jgi:hypothetical protein
MKQKVFGAKVGVYDSFAVEVGYSFSSLKTPLQSEVFVDVVVAGV